MPVPQQLRIAQANALNWWRDSANRVTSVESVQTNSMGARQRTLVFILRDPNGRSLAVGVAGSVELSSFFYQRLDQRMALAVEQHLLSDEQVQKLRLAADLDIPRFNRRVQEAEQSMNAPVAAQGVQNIKQQLATISQDCDGELFGKHSLFGRVLATMLVEKP